jgi:ribosomal RNA assembly protein
MEHLARIPKDRIAVLIGKRGVTRKMIENACDGKLNIDSVSGEVNIIWNSEDVDPIVRMKMPDVIMSIGRG